MKHELNAHMNQKSTIQLVAEVLDMKESFFRNLTSITETYTVDDAVFCCDQNGKAHNLNEGYYGEVAIYDTLNEAKQNCNILMQAIRIHGDKFAVGNLYRNLSDVKESLVIDLAKSTIL